MSLMKKIAENYLRGATLGVSELVGVTGHGGLIHDTDEDAEIIIDACEDNVHFLSAGIVVPLSHFSSCQERDNSTVLDLAHLGGLRIRVPLSRVSRVELADESISSKFENAPTLSSLLSAEENTEAHFEDQKENLERAFNAIDESKQLYEVLNGSSGNIILEEYFALLNIKIFLLVLKRVLLAFDASDQESDWKFNAELQLWLLENNDRVDALADIAEFWRDRTSEGYAEQDDILKDAAEAYASVRYCVRYGLADKQDPDDEGYALAHSAVFDGVLPDNEMWIKWLDETFASQEYAKKRKIILCTECGRSIDAIGKVVDDFAIVRAHDLEQVIDYQKRDDPLDSLKGQRDAAHKDEKDIPITEAKKKAAEYRENRERRFLKFEEGHPRNDTLYVQHPYDPNTYIELEAFHCGMLERKYNELISILTSLGAKEITCSVENSDSRDMRQKSHVAGGGSLGKEHIGRVEADASRDSESSKKKSLYKKLDTHLELIPNSKPELPPKLTYYPFEEGWRQLAQKALEGRVVKASVDLTYRKDYAVTGKYVKSLNAKIESLIPAYDFSASGHYESEIESELKELESTVWHYEVAFGCGETQAADTELVQKTDQIACNESSASAFSQQELSVLRRARRYAQTEEAQKTGMLTEAQRSDLERLAGKYGVESNRVEEIIDEAFA